MRRNIWKKLPAELQKRLSTPGCREYKRREELMEVSYERGKKGTASNAEYDRLSDECDQFYENLCDVDKAAIEDECDITCSNDDVSLYLLEAAMREANKGIGVIFV